MSEFELTRAERRSAVRSFWLIFGNSELVRHVRFGDCLSFLLHLPSFGSLCNYFIDCKHRGDPALLEIAPRGFKCKAGIQLLMEDLCVRYSAVDKRVSLLNNLSTIPLLGLFNVFLH